MRSWGCRGAPALRRSRAPIASSPRSITPTANKNDPKSAARFSELNSANEIIGDEDKRKQFDRGEIDAEGKPRFQGFPGGDPRGARRRARRRLRNPHLPHRRRRSGRLWRRRLRGHPQQHVQRRRRARRAARRGQHLRVRSGRHRARSRSQRRHDGVAGRIGQGRREARPVADRQGTQCQDSRRRYRRPADPAEGAGRDRARPSARRSPDHGQHRAASLLQGRRQRSAGRSADHAV